MTLDEWRLLWIVARLWNVIELLEDRFLYGECFIDARTGWRVAPFDVPSFRANRDDVKGLFS